MGKINSYYKCNHVIMITFVITRFYSTYDDLLLNSFHESFLSPS